MRVLAPRIGALLLILPLCWCRHAREAGRPNPSARDRDAGIVYGPIGIAPADWLAGNVLGVHLGMTIGQYCDEFGRAGGCWRDIRRCDSGYFNPPKTIMKLLPFALDGGMASIGIQDGTVSEIDFSVNLDAVGATNIRKEADQALSYPLVDLQGGSAWTGKSVVGGQEAVLTIEIEDTRKWGAGLPASQAANVAKIAHSVGATASEPWRVDVRMRRPRWTGGCPPNASNPVAWRKEPRPGDAKAAGAAESGGH